MTDHFDFQETPLTKMETLSHKFGCSIFMKRDDLFPHGGGGSKARMLQYILWNARLKGSDYILTAGGPYSNFNRALALLCRKYGLKMRLVLYDKNTHIQKDSLNKRVLDYCDVEIVECKAENVGEILKEEKELLIQKGFIPYFIWGGGKSKEGVRAYIDCFKSIEYQLNNKVKYIFTALGTGTTYSGLMLGTSGSTKVIGISVARASELASQVVEEIILEYDHNIIYDQLKGEIVDKYAMGGYGFSSSELDDFTKNIIQDEGIIFDTIYVGKALYGMTQYLEEIRQEIRGETIVFLNTGGIFNF